MGPTTLPAPPQIGVGSVLGETYELKAVLGEGGMGKVYEAHDRLMNRKVAVKVSHSAQFAPMLRNEAQALAAIRHPTAVTVHHYGREGDVEYLVMERIQGTSLDIILAQYNEAGYRQTIREVLDLLIPLVEGVAAAHRAGVSHRDIKPANVMVTPTGRLVLMDYGLVLPEFSGQAPRAPAGSPDYMPPEAITGTVKPGSGHLVDIYSLGMVAFELLLGHPPFESSSVEETLHKQMESQLPPLGILRPDAPTALVGLIREMTDKDSAARPQSAEDIVWQLRKVTLPTPSHRPGAKPMSVLVVDDDDGLRSAIVTHLQSLRPAMRVSDAPDAETALHLMKRRTPDVLVVDLELPRMSGLELAMYVRGAHARCSVVAISARANEKDITLLGQLGAKGFLPKDSALFDALSGTLHHEQTVREGFEPTK